jgi:hypothetical protein
MAERKAWCSEHDDKILDMKSREIPLKTIAIHFNITVADVKNFLNRHARTVKNGGIAGKRGGDHCSLKQEEIDRRLKVYESGANDREASKILGLKEECFKSWRYSRNLPINKSVKKPYTTRTYKRYEEEEIVSVKVEKEKCVLKNGDIDNYNHLKNVIIAPERRDILKVIVDIGLAEKLATEAKAEPIACKLEERVKARRLSKAMYVEAKRTFGIRFVRSGC